MYRAIGHLHRRCCVVLSSGLLLFGVSRHFLNLDILRVLLLSQMGCCYLLQPPPRPRTHSCRVGRGTGGCAFTECPVASLSPAQRHPKPDVSPTPCNCLIACFSQFVSSALSQSRCAPSLSYSVADPKFALAVVCVPCPLLSLPGGGRGRVVLVGSNTHPQKDVCTTLALWRL